MDAPLSTPISDQDEVYSLLANDPDGLSANAAGLSDEVIQQTEKVMAALGRLREAERRLSEESRRYMKLNETDMRALHLLIVRGNRHEIATAGDIAAHLGISSASTTKLLDRLEAAGHVVRRPHPTDRRALSITIAPATRRAALDTMGRHQARRFLVAAQLSPDERALVTRFLDEMADQLGQGDDAGAAVQSAEE